MPAPPFERFAGLCALLAGIGSFLYALVFLVLHNTGLSALVLLLVGLLSAAALVAVYLRLHETDAAFALWAFLMSVTGAIGSAIHGGYDLALALHPVPPCRPCPTRSIRVACSASASQASGWRCWPGSLCAATASRRAWAIWATSRRSSSLSCTSGG